MKLLTAALLGLAVGCGANLANLYGAELLQCVETSDTLKQSQECRCEVNKRYGRECGPEARDGGESGR